MSTARDIMLATGTSMENKPGQMLGGMLSLLLGIVALFLVYMGIAQKGGSHSGTFFVAGIVFFALAFIFNIGGRSFLK
jgi:hypothetical protein